MHSTVLNAEKLEGHALRDLKPALRLQLPCRVPASPSCLSSQPYVCGVAASRCTHSYDGDTDFHLQAPSGQMWPARETVSNRPNRPKRLQHHLLLFPAAAWGGEGKNFPEFRTRSAGDHCPDPGTSMLGSRASGRPR